MIAPSNYLNAKQIYEALSIRDLSDPTQGHHAMQELLKNVTTALTSKWECTLNMVRNPPIVAVTDNYDRLGYDGADITRAQRYTRYTSPTTMLRSHTSAELPRTLEQYASSGAGTDTDELIAAPGLVFRRDVVDRTHVGEPHQIDLWRIRSTPHTTDGDMMEMIDSLVSAVLPGAEWRTIDVVHPYTLGGRQIDVLHNGEWLELAECGRIHPGVLSRSGLDPAKWSGLALGMGLERALMLRKAIPDIRFLRATDERIATQMQDLSTWRNISMMPIIKRDISIVIDRDMDDETIGDTIRTAMGQQVDDIEATEVLARTSFNELPQPARKRLGIEPGQVNYLVRLTLRPLERTLTDDEANVIRNTVYRALHQGPNLELI